MSALVLQQYNNQLPHSFEATQAQRNLVMRLEQQPMSLPERVRRGIPFFAPCRELQALFPNAYHKYFDWRREEHLNFCFRMRDALKAAFNTTGNLQIWLTKNNINRAYYGILMALSRGQPVPYEKRPYIGDAQDAFIKYCKEFFYPNLWHQIYRENWLCVDLLEGPNALLDLSAAHMAAAGMVIGDALIGVVQQKIGDSIVCKLTPVMDIGMNNAGLGGLNAKIVDWSENLSEIQRIDRRVSGGGLLADQIGGGVAEQVIEFGKGQMLSGKLVQNVSEYVIKFSPKEVSDIIKDYQISRKRNPNLTVPDPVSNPFFEKILASAAMVQPKLKGVEKAYGVAKGLINLVAHLYEAKDLREQALSWRFEILQADQRGLREGKGHSASRKIRSDAITRDMKYATQNSNQDLITYLQKLFVKFLDVRDPLLQFNINTIVPPEEDGFIVRKGEALESWARDLVTDDIDLQRRALDKEAEGRRVGTKLQPTPYADEIGAHYPPVQ